jgi:branched-chain amino acid transport system substrate-binding protein
MTVVATEFYNRNAMADFTPLILKLKALQPDVIVAATYTNDSILFWRQARQLDFNIKALVSAGAVGFGSPDFGKTFGNIAEGPFTVNQANDINLNALSKDGAALEVEVKKRYEATYKEPYGGSALLGATGVAVLAEILKKTGGDLNPDKFRAAATGLDIPIGSLVHGWGAKFDANGQNLDERVLFPVTQWQNGNQITVWPEKFAVAPARNVPLPKWADRK